MRDERKIRIQERLIDDLTEQVAKLQKVNETLCKEIENGNAKQLEKIQKQYKKATKKMNECVKEYKKINHIYKSITSKYEREMERFARKL